jgi:Fe-S oxidoreductase/nitrate reductase gamma subunit
VVEATRAIPWRRLGTRARDWLVNAVVQPRTWRRPYAGVAHGLIFWGVTVQVIGTLVNLLQTPLFVPYLTLAFPRGPAYLALELVLDLAGLAIIAGVLLALWRRLALRPRSLETRRDDLAVLGLLLLLPTLGFLVEGLRLVALAPAWANWSPVGLALAAHLRGLGLSAAAAQTLHAWAWWCHVAAAVLFVAAIPFSKLRHLVAIPLNIAVRPARHDAALAPIPDLAEAETLGAGHIEDFSAQQLLSFDACVRCGRCEDSCPAALSGQAFSPRALVAGLRAALAANLLQPAAATNSGANGAALLDQGEWRCTTCGACVTGCPAFVSPVSAVVERRRYHVLTAGVVPATAANACRGIERYGNPWGLPPDQRQDWAAGLDLRVLQPGERVDVLYFVGCCYAYDDRNRKVARAFVQLLKRAGADFAVLGPAEGCCGETARRLGNEYLFQQLAEQNVARLQTHRFERIVTQCAHCYNTLKNEYPQFGGNWRVQHYSEYLAEHLPDWTCAADGAGAGPRVVYHDSCYLGRYNGLYAQPRALLDRTGLARAEAGRHGANALCCGGGGGQMWLESDPQTRINQLRLDEMVASGAGLVATACPYCLLMFDDAIRTRGLGERMQVKDLAEILVERLAPAAPEAN